jgi:hypothetical protein
MGGRARPGSRGGGGRGKGASTGPTAESVRGLHLRVVGAPGSAARPPPGTTTTSAAKTSQEAAGLEASEWSTHISTNACQILC